MADKKVLGTGMKFPPRVNPATGRFEVSTASQSVKESVYLILMTQKTERMVRPAFGSTIVEYTFMDMTETMITMMSRDIRADILTQEPRIADVEIGIEPKQDKGCLLVNISYTLAEGNIKDNMIFPFYLDTEGEEDEEIDRFETL